MEGVEAGTLDPVMTTMVGDDEMRRDVWIEGKKFGGSGQEVRRKRPSGALVSSCGVPRSGPTRLRRAKATFASHATSYDDLSTTTVD